MALKAGDRAHHVPHGAFLVGMPDQCAFGREARHRLTGVPSGLVEHLDAMQASLARRERLAPLLHEPGVPRVADERPPWRPEPAPVEAADLDGQVVVRSGNPAHRSGSAATGTDSGSSSSSSIAPAMAQPCICNRFHTPSRVTVSSPPQPPQRRRTIVRGTPLNSADVPGGGDASLTDIW